MIRLRGAPTEALIFMASERNEPSMNATFIILRREMLGGYSTRGPIAQPLSLKEARAEVLRLKKAFPHQDFVIMGEVGEATMSERVTVKIDAPDLGDTQRKKRRRKLPEDVAVPAIVDDTNVVPLRKEEAG